MNAKKLIGGLLVASSMLLAGAAMAESVNYDSDTAPVNVTIEKYCYVRNIDSTVAASGEGWAHSATHQAGIFTLDVAGNAALESNNGTASDDVVFQTYANFPYLLHATLTPDAKINSATAKWAIGIDGEPMFQDSLKAVYQPDGSTTVTPCEIKTVPVHLSLSGIGLDQLFGNYNAGSVILEIEDKAF